MEGLMDAAIKAAVDDWTAMDVADMWSFTVINDYIEKHEDALVAFGMFVRGMRVRPVRIVQLEFHHTMEGMRGIICMNVEILKQKIKWTLL